jgi:hypothetical protein
MGARWYDSSLGRWTQPDTLVPDQYNPADWDRFQYVRSNPLKYYDPSGHMVTDGCEYEGCSVSWREKADENYRRQREYHETCQGGQGQYCPDYLEITAFTITGLVLTSLAAEIAVGLPTEIQSLVATSAELWEVLKLRYSYERAVRMLKSEVDRRLLKGFSLEDVARFAHQARRNLGITYKGQTPPELLQLIYARNIEKYGDKLGPSIEYLRYTAGKSWSEIIESATRPGGYDLYIKVILYYIKR